MRSFQKKKNTERKTPLNRSNFSSQRSFAKMPDRGTSDEKLKFHVKNKQSDDYSHNIWKIAKWNKKRIYSKDGYSTVRMNKNSKNADRNNSFRPPTNVKVSPKRNYKLEKDLRMIYSSPKTPIQIPYMSYSLVRDSSLEERREVLRKHSMLSIYIYRYEKSNNFCKV